MTSPNMKDLMERGFGTKIDVLDHGFVRLVDFMGNDLSIVRSARVSHNADWRAEKDNPDKNDVKLIDYLWRNQHSTPFESVEFQFEVMAPIFVFRQWHRHRTQSYNEISARYTSLSDIYYVPEEEHVGTQSSSNHQSRELIGQTASTNIVKAIADHSAVSFATYENLIDDDCPRELARSVLPVNTYSRMFAKANLLNWLRFISLRDHNHAQFEIQVYAQAIRDLITPIVPVTMGVFDENKRIEKIKDKLYNDLHGEEKF